MSIKTFTGGALRIGDMEIPFSGGEFLSAAKREPARLVEPILQPLSSTLTMSAEFKVMESSYIGVLCRPLQRVALADAWEPDNAWRQMAAARRKDIREDENGDLFVWWPLNVMIDGIEEPSLRSWLRVYREDVSHE